MLPSFSLLSLLSLLQHRTPRRRLPAGLQSMAPPEHTATASTSTLCKLLTWDSQQLWQRLQAEGRVPQITHQADWLAALLHGQGGVTDWNNALKLGYDPGNQEYPDWLADQVNLNSYNTECDGCGAKLMDGLLILPGRLGSRW